MTREEAKKAAEVMLAYANGEKIETLSWGEYVPCEEPTFNWISGKGLENYRIKPKEKFDPKTLKPFDKVLARDDFHDEWMCTFFSHIQENSDRPYVGVNLDWRCCIPYNDDTKHLVGTTKEAPEYYKYWED